MADNYKVSDKVRDVIANDYRLLQVISRFGISLGFGEKTISEVCGQRGVDAQTFVAVINYVRSGGEYVPPGVEELSVGSLLEYLRQTHAYFLDYMFPLTRRNMLNAIDCSVKNEVAFLMLKFYDEYVEEVRKHMRYEENVTFRFVEQLLAGKSVSRQAMADSPRLLSAHHENFERKLQELKNLFVQYYPQTETSNELNEVLYQLYRTQEDLSMHCRVEDCLFLPAVRHLERVTVPQMAEVPEVEESGEGDDVLSAREKEIVACVAKGMANKEIADTLCLSINTVTTHRRNIARKLSIHSSAGITIYAIVHQLVSLDDINL